MIFFLRLLDGVCLVSAAALWTEHHPLAAIGLLACYAWPWRER